MSQSKLVKSKWLSRPSNTYRYPITSRPDQKLLPKWMMEDKLLCNEVFTYRVPTLKNIACAAIISNDLDNNFNEYEEHIWEHNAREPIELVTKGYCTNGNRYHDCTTQCYYATYHIQAYDAHEWRESHKIIHAFPHAPYDVVFKGQEKDFSYEKRRDGLRRNPPVKRKLNFDSDSD